MPPITAEQCVALLRDYLANRPEDLDSEQAREWFADIAGTISAHDWGLGVGINAQLPQVASRNIGRDGARIHFIADVRRIYTQLRLQSNAFQTAQVAAGAVHDYFEEIRQIIAGATTEVLFTDAYLDPSFVERYMPQIPVGVSVRLLATQGKGAALKAACNLYTQQHATAIEVRTVPNQSLHDRHLVIDGREVYQSGASFKDGGRHAPTSINQIVDVAADLIRALEGTWGNATPLP